MKAMKIIDLLKGEETLNFENTGLILMTGITESSISSIDLPEFMLT